MGSLLVHFYFIGSLKRASILVVFPILKSSCSTQILEAREGLLQSSPTKHKLLSESRNTREPEESELSPSSIQNKHGVSEAPSFQELTSDPVPNVEADKHPISSTEAEIVDKSVIQEELVMKTEAKSLPTEESNPDPADDDDEKEVDDWLQDVDSVPSKTGNPTAVGEEEDVSFSDLEDDWGAVIEPTSYQFTVRR